MKYKSLVIVIFTCLLAALFSRNIVHAQIGSSGVATIEIAQVDNSAYPDVTLYIRVLNNKGERIPNLAQDLFQVTEDGTPVEITKYSAYNISSIVSFLVVDVSSSMLDEGKIEGAKQAALKFIELMRPQDQVGLISFNESVHVNVSLTNKKNLLLQAVGSLSASGNTAWHDGVVKAAQLLSAVPGRKSIVVLTDGLDNQSQNSLAEATKKIQGIETPVYTIGLGARPSGLLNSGGFNKPELTSIAEQTGGKFYETPSANKLPLIFQEISQSTQGEYVITYRSPRPDYDGTRRNINITAGQISNKTAYLEKHLVTIQSDPLLGFLILPFLLMLMVFPIALQATLRQVQARKAKRASKGTLPGNAPTPAIPVQAKSKVCAYCKQPIRPNVRFCPTCGKSITTTSPPNVAAPRHCTHCGRPLRPGAKFCAACGVRCV